MPTIMISINDTDEFWHPPPNLINEMFTGLTRREMRTWFWSNMYFRGEQLKYQVKRTQWKNWWSPQLKKKIAFLWSCYKSQMWCECLITHNSL